LDGAQNYEYIPAMSIYALVPRHMQIKPVGAVQKVALAVALMQHHGVTTIFTSDDYQKFLDHFAPDYFTHSSVEQVA